MNLPLLDNPNSTFVMYLRDAADSDVAGVEVRSTNYFRFYHSNYGSSYTQLSAVAGEKIYVWLVHIPATDGVGGTLHINTNSEDDYSTSTALASVTTGSHNSTASKLQLGHLTNNLGASVIFDNVRVQYVPFN
jgi:hypothetical protein